MKVLSSLAALLFSSLVFANPLHHIVIFGDSLSDNGNFYARSEHKIPPSPPYYEGRFTNGPVWVERLAEAYFPVNTAKHLHNYAFGGAGISDNEDDDSPIQTLKSELDLYFAANQDKADADSLYIVWLGANNYLAVPEDEDNELANVNAGIKHGLQRLIDAGAKHILVLNLPDLGKTPFALDSNLEKKMTYFSMQHNQLLTDTIKELSEAHPDVQCLYFDVHQTLNDLLVAPKQHGFTNITDTCYDIETKNKPTQRTVLYMAQSLKGISKENVCDGYLFFDPVHPTAPAHQIMAESAKQFLDTAGVEFSD